ncbi:MAG: DUF2283 domain-containing protein [Syntrophales bacterium LBB04]|nr:DUF2283 domain-containing protein [Syntrophales bacterium LBB04]
MKIEYDREVDALYVRGTVKRRQYDFKGHSRGRF